MYIKHFILAGNLYGEVEVCAYPSCVNVQLSDPLRRGENRAVVIQPALWVRYIGIEAIGSNIKMTVCEIRVYSIYGKSKTRA